MQLDTFIEKNKKPKHSDTTLHEIRENMLYENDGIEAMFSGDDITFYLRQQGLNRHIPPRQLISATNQLGQGIIVNSADDWAKLGRTVNPGADGIDVCVNPVFDTLSDGIINGSIQLLTLYEISETTGRKFSPTAIKSGTWEMKSAFLALMSMQPGELIIDRSLDCAAEYQPDMNIYINPDMPEDRLFCELCRETHFAAYDPITLFDEDSAEPCIDYDYLMFDAECVSYMVCTAYGIEPAALRNTHAIENHYGLLSVDSQEVVLSRLFADANNICAKIDYELRRLERDRLKSRKDYGR